MLVSYLLCFAATDQIGSPFIHQPSVKKIPIRYYFKNQIYKKRLICLFLQNLSRSKRPTFLNFKCIRTIFIRFSLQNYVSYGVKGQIFYLVFQQYKDFRFISSEPYNYKGKTNMMVGKSKHIAYILIDILGRFICDLCGKLPSSGPHLT